MRLTRRRTLSKMTLDDENLKQESNMKTQKTTLITSQSKGELKLEVSNGTYRIEHKLTQEEIKGLLRVLTSALK